MVSMSEVSSSVGISSTSSLAGSSTMVSMSEVSSSVGISSISSPAGSSTMAPLRASMADWGSITASMTCTMPWQVYTSLCAMVALPLAATMVVPS